MDQTKLANAQNVLFNQVYLPAVIETYNTKAASVGYPPIQSEADLAKALDLIEYIQTVKQASVGNPIGNAFNKVAGVVNGLNTNPAQDFAKQASANPQLLAALKSALA